MGSTEVARGGVDRNAVDGVAEGLTGGSDTRRAWSDTEGELGEDVPLVSGVGCGGDEEAGRAGRAGRGSAAVVVRAGSRGSGPPLRQDKVPARRTRGCRMWAGGVGRAQTRAGRHIGSRRAGGARGRRSRANSVCRTRARATSRCGWRSATRSAKRCRGHFEDATKRDKVDEQIDRGCPWQASGDRRAWRRRRWLNSSLVETGSLNRGQARHFLAPPTRISHSEDYDGGEDMQIVRLRHVRRIRAGGRDYCYRQPT